MNLVVALGGTGQLTLHYYLQWYLTGVTERGDGASQPLRAVVIDPDQRNLMASLRFAADFFSKLAPESRLPGDIPAPWVSIPDVFSRETPKLGTLLSGNEGDLPEDEPARAFFDRSTLDQTIDHGFYGRPALASVLLTNPKYRARLEKALDDAISQSGGPASAKVIVIGSLIGGAGGGLLIPVLDHFLDRHVSRTMAVLFAPYFEVEHKDKIRHESNYFALLPEVLSRYQGEGGFALRQFVPVEGNIKRNPTRETDATDLPWPPTDPGTISPLAEACWAVDEMLHNTVAHAPSDAATAVLDLSPRKVQEKWQEAAAARDQALSALRLLSLDGLINQALKDPMAGTLFGQDTANCLTELAAWHEEATGVPVDFGNALAHEVAILMNGPGYSFSQWLPLGRSKPSLVAVRHSSKYLGQVKKGRLPPSRTKQQVVETAARLLVFLLLRAGPAR